MFCPKCGTKALDGAEFCQKCGAKLIFNDAERESSGMADHQAQPDKAPAYVLKKKKRKKLPIILGALAVLILFVIIIVSIGGSEEPADTTGVNLSETYNNENEGISFKYPKAWVPVGEEEFISRFGSIEDEEYPLVLLANETDDLPEANTYIMVSKFPATQDVIDHLFIDDEQFAATFDDSATVKNTSTTEIDGVAAREITYLTSDGIGYQSYFYAVEAVIYRIDFSWRGETPGNNQRFFDAIIDSYTIKIDLIRSGEPTPDSTTTTGLCYRGVLVDDLLGISYEGFISIFGEPDSSLFDGEENTYGDVEVYFDLYSQDIPYLSYIISPDLSDFTYNGQPITDSYHELTQLIGREPDENRLYYDTYQMIYTWDHMGSQAFLVVEAPLTDESYAATSVSVSWWNDTSEGNYDTEFTTNGLPDGFEWVEAPSWTTKSYGSYINQEMITGVIKNTSGSTKSYVQISFNLYDANGYQIGQAMGNISNLGAGSSWKFEAWPMGVSGTIASYEFASLTGW